MILTAIMTSASIMYGVIKNIIQNKNLNPSNSTTLNETIISTIPTSIPSIPETIFSSEISVPTSISSTPETNFNSETIVPTSILSTSETKNTSSQVETTIPTITSETINTSSQTETTIPAITTIPIPQPTTIQTTVKITEIYYSACDSSHVSLVDALKSIGVDSSMANRKIIAQINNITDYSGTSEQNLELLNKLKKGILIKSLSSTIIEVPIPYISSDEINDSFTESLKTSEIIDSATEETNYKIKYFPKCDESFSSFSDAFKTVWCLDSLEYIKKVAEANNIPNYIGSAKQNIELLNNLKKGLLIRPSITLVPLKEIQNESDIINMMEKLKNNNKYKDISDTLPVIGKALLNHGYKPSFVAGILGNIFYEGTIGLLERANYNKNPLPKYLENMNNKYEYKEIYAGKKIFELSLFKIRDILEELRQMKFKMNPNDDKKNIGFGMGCAQWTWIRTYTLAQFYLDENGEKDKISYEQACEAEIKMLLSELTYEKDIKDIYDKWRTEQEKKNINIDSEDAAGNAGILFCLDFEKPHNITEMAKIRAPSAKDIYKVMMS